MTAPFKPFEPAPEGYHRHQCKFCAFTWEHANVNDAHHNAVVGSHECPACHRCNWGMGIYDGPDAPAVRNGADPDVPTPISSIHPDQMLATPGELRQVVERPG